MNRDAIFQGILATLLMGALSATSVLAQSGGSGGGSSGTGSGSGAGSGPAMGSPTTPRPGDPAINSGSPTDRSGAPAGSSLGIGPVPGNIDRRDPANPGGAPTTRGSTFPGNPDVGRTPPVTDFPAVRRPGDPNETAPIMPPSGTGR